MSKEKTSCAFHPFRKAYAVRPLDLEPEHIIRKIVVNVEEDNGFYREKVEVTSVSSREPQTPQTGVETKACDLSFMLAHNIDVKHGSVSLPLVYHNPFESFSAAAAAAAALNSASEVIDNSKTQQK